MKMPTRTKQKRRYVTLAEDIYKAVNRPLEVSLAITEAIKIRKTLCELLPKLYEIEELHIKCAHSLDGEISEDILVHNTKFEEVYKKQYEARQKTNEISHNVNLIQAQMSRTRNSMALQYQALVLLPNPNQILKDILSLDEIFDDVKFNLRHKYIEGITKEDIILEDAYSKPHNLGKFKIRYKYSDTTERHSRIRVFALTPQQHALADNNVIHPHVKHNELCTGDYGKTITSLMKYAGIFGLFELVLNMLQTYNPGSPYITLESWDGNECDHCGELVSERTTCNSCEDQCCLNCLVRCEYCKEYVCRSCLSEQEAKTLGLDYEYLCKECIQHIRYCADCKEIIQQYEQHDCRLCKSTLCHTCWGQGKYSLCAFCADQEPITQPFGPILPPNLSEHRETEPINEPISEPVIVLSPTPAPSIQECADCRQIHNNHITCVNCHNPICNNCRVRCTGCRTYSCLNCLKPVGPEGDLYCEVCAAQQGERGA